MSSSKPPIARAGAGAGAAAAAAVDADTAKILRCLGARSTAEVVAIDCEMVGAERGSMLAQVSIIGFDGKPVYQTFVRPSSPVFDYRTQYSGITAKTPLAAAPSFAKVRAAVIRCLTGKVVVGVATENDLGFLRFTEAERATFRVIDVSTLEIFQVEHKGPKEPKGPAVSAAVAEPKGPPKTYCPRLKILAWACLGRAIQTGVHDATEDAVATLDVLKHVCLVGEKARDDLLRVMTEHEAVLDGRNVPAGVEHQKMKDEQKAALAELRIAQALAEKTKAQYEAGRNSLEKHVIDARLKAFEDARQKVKDLSEQEEALSIKADSFKRRVVDKRRAARNAIMFEGANPNVVAPRLGTAVATGATGAATGATGAARGGAGGPSPPKRKTRRSMARRDKQTRRRTR